MFVLDKSGASAQTDIFKQAKAFLEEINQKAKADGLNIKVGVVLFNKMGNVQLPLTDVVAGYDDILNAMNSSVRSGTNMDAGLLAAKSILDADTAVKAENKHVILISDGATYLYCKNGDLHQTVYEVVWRSNQADESSDRRCIPLWIEQNGRYLGVAVSRVQFQ